MIFRFVGKRGKIRIMVLCLVCKVLLFLGIKKQQEVENESDRLHSLFLFYPALVHATLADFSGLSQLIFFSIVETQQ